MRDVVLSALCVARAEAHVAFDTTAAQRRADADDIDTILVGVLRALSTTVDVDMEAAPVRDWLMRCRGVV